MEAQADAPVEPLFPQVTEHDTYTLVVMPRGWPLEPLYQELGERGLRVLGCKEKRGLWHIRVSKPQTPEDEPEAVAA
jgi:hypothetical protein